MFTARGMPSRCCAAFRAVVQLPFGELLVMSKPNRAAARNAKIYTKLIRVKLTPAQYKRLMADKGGQAISDYVRDKIFDEDPGVSHLADVAREVALARNLVLAQVPAEQRHIDRFLDLATSFRDLVNVYHIRPLLFPNATEAGGKLYDH